MIGDFRAPDVLRFGFTPLYTRFTPLYTRFVDVWDAAEILSDQVAQGEKHNFEFVIAPPVVGALFGIFSSFSDEGSKNPYGDIGIAEIWAE